MPIYSRQSLRRTLGQVHIRDTFVSVTTLSVAPQPFANVVIDYAVADLRLSGQNAYAGAWIRIFGGDLRVASFNAGSGAYLSTEYGVFMGNPSIGMPYERHDVLSPTDKDRALDDSIKRLRVRREVAIDTVEGLHTYTMPDGVQDILGWYYFANPAGSLDRVRKSLASLEPVITATGVELRIDPALAASQQIVLDAIVTLTLGAADTATVNIPDERLVLYGAEAECWDLMVRKAPRGTADEYRNLRNEAARQFNLLSARFKVPVDRPLRLRDPGGQAF